jgi:hypothetical protein
MSDEPIPAPDLPQRPWWKQLWGWGKDHVGQMPTEPDVVREKQIDDNETSVSVGLKFKF